MSDLSATNCGCGCDDGRRGNGCGCGNDCGFANNSCLWIILLLICVADTAMTVACGSSYYSSCGGLLAMVVAGCGGCGDATVATTVASPHLSKCSVDFL